MSGVRLTRDGQPLVSVRLVPGSDWESAALAQDTHFLSIIERSRRSYQESGGIGIERLRRELGLESGPRHVDSDDESRDLPAPDA